MNSTSEADTGDEVELEAEAELDLESLDPADFRSRSGSFSSSALPHPHLPEGLEWEIRTCVTDGGEDVPIEPTTNTLSAIGQDWETITLTATVTFPEWAYDFVTPEDGATDADPPWTGRLGLVYWCPETIFRESSEPVTIEEPGSHQIDIEIDREEIWMSATVCPALVLVESNVSREAFAHQPGHRIAEGESWRIKTDLERSTRNLLHPETKKFSEDDDLPGDDHLVFLDFDRDPPGLYLNDDHERIISALDSDSNRGWDAAVRDAAYDTIEAEIWPQLLLEAASDITGGEEPETPWKQGVIEKFREEIYGEDVSYEEALQLLEEDVASPQRLPRLMHDLDDAIQRRNDAPSHLNKLLSLVDNR
jgi:hypothetical protein